MKKISVLTPTFNEEENIELLYKKIKEQFSSLSYDYEHIVIDNNSNDKTIEILRDLCQKDKKLKVIINNKNYGQLNSPFYGMLQTNSDATIVLSADFQDPIELIPKLINLWEQGNRVVLTQKIKTNEKFLIKFLRKSYYKILSKISQNDLTRYTTGAGIYDREIISIFRSLKDPMPYLRGLVSEIEGNIILLEFEQPKRKYGKTKNNIFSLIDVGMLGFVKHSKLPLRLMIIFGFILSFVSITISLIFFLYKLFFWNSFDLGIAPIIIGLFFISAIQMILLGFVGEYISTTLTHVRNLPLVVEKERINFDE
jgi:glycosyltransferase involved in cell wall biosynthesis